MKKFFGITLLLAITTLGIFSTYLQAQKGKGNCKNKQNCSKFVDINNDGKCDNFIDANGDGKCDDCTGSGVCDKTGKGKGQGKQNCGMFADANADGKCDNKIDANNDGKCDNNSNSGACDKSGKCLNQSKNNRNECKMNPNKSNSATNFTLNQNAPNPVTGNTKISFNLKETNVVKVILSDKLGNKVKDVFEGSLSMGDHEIELSVIGLNPGNYFYSVFVGGKVQTKQLVIVK